MNRTFQYNEYGKKILRRDFQIKSQETVEKDLLNFIRDLSQKGIINMNFLKNEIIERGF